MRGMSAKSHLPGAQRRNRNGISEKSGKKADEFKFMDTVLRTLTNSKTVDEINSLDLPLPEYKTIFNAVMAACSGQTLEEFEESQKRFQ